MLIGFIISLLSEGVLRSSGDLYGDKGVTFRRVVSLIAFAGFVVGVGIMFTASSHLWSVRHYGYELDKDKVNFVVAKETDTGFARMYRWKVIYKPEYNYYMLIKPDISHVESITYFGLEKRHRALLSKWESESMSEDKLEKIEYWKGLVGEQVKEVKESA